jgi:hypothetical protein
VREQKGIDIVSDRILIRGGIVLTQDDALGELPNADILVDGEIRVGDPVRAEADTDATAAA